MHLEGGGPVFEVVGFGDGLPGELPLLPDEDESLVHRIGDGGAEDETPGFRSDDEVEVDVLHHIDEAVHGHVESVGIAEDGGDVSEDYALLGEVRDLRDVVSELFHRPVTVCP